MYTGIVTGSLGRIGELYENGRVYRVGDPYGHGFYFGIHEVLTFEEECRGSHSIISLMIWMRPFL